MRLCAGLAALSIALVLAASAYGSHDVTELVSFGPTGGNGTQAANFRGISTDGSRVFFQTTEKLVSGDTDSAIDVYERAGGATTLLSTGPTGGNGAFSATYSGTSTNGTKVFFRTGEKLVSADTDNAMDVYMREAGTTTLLSLGPNGGNGVQTVIFKGSSQDGTRVFFETSESLISSDSDIARDVYQWSGGTVTRLSTGPGGGNSNDFDTFFEAASADGTHVFMNTDEQLVGSDTDPTADVYERFGSTTTHLSIGPAGGNGNIDFDYDAFFDGASADGSKVWLDSDEVLTADDTDTGYDIYEHSGATITRISTGPAGGNGGLDAFFNANSADGTRVFFDTIEPLVAGDTDPGTDIYERSGGTTTLMSTGPSGGNGGQFSAFAGITSDGLNLFFTTPEKLTADDTDTVDDVYQRSGGTTTRVSTSPTGGNAEIPAEFAGISADGARVFISTSEQLVSADGDAWLDLYERNAGATTFISKGPNSTNQDFLTPFFRAASQDGLKVFFETAESLLNTDTDVVQDVYAATQGTPGGFPRPKGATPVRVPLVPAFAPCTTPNREHAPTLSFPSCNPPAQTLPLLTIGTPDVNAQVANSNNNYVQFKLLGVAGGPEDSDVQVSANLTDVRNTSDLTDYTGELQVVVNLNISDKDPVNLLQSTIAPLPFTATIPCTPTVSTTIGSACSVTTTADTLIPGMVPESKRTIWELGQVRVLDGGPDNLAATADNNLFKSQGVFVP